MLLLIFSIFFILSIFLFCKDEDEIGAVFIFLSGICLAAIICVTIPIIKGRILDQEIAMYQEENTVIESQIETLVTKYMNYEQETFEKCNAESMMTLVDLYPELKSDTLVSKQIDVYLANNEKIKSLKHTKLSISVYRWWLYFGR